MIDASCVTFIKRTIGSRYPDVPQVSAQYIGWLVRPPGESEDQPAVPEPAETAV